MDKLKKNLQDWENRYNFAAKKFQMASFELIGYIKNIAFHGGQPQLTVGEYIQGRRDAVTGETNGERMDRWFVFMPKSSAGYVRNFKPNDLVVVKGTIHQAASASSEYAYCVNGETVKHFYTRNLFKDEKLVKNSQKAAETTGERPDLANDKLNDF